MTSAVLTTTALEIINKSMSLLNVKDANQALSTAVLTDALLSLNMMIKSWQAQGLHLWTKTEGVVFLDIEKQSYELGPGGDPAVNLDDLITTTVSVDALENDNVITLTSVAGVVVGSTIGIELDDGSRQLTTAASISVNDVTLDDALTDSAIIGNTVFVINDLMPRPIRILDLRRSEIGSDDSEIQANQWSRQEYFAQTNKDSQGTVNNWYYSPQLVNGRLHIWQTANNVNQLVKFSYIRPLDIMEDTAGSPDFPSEWFYPLAYNLAVLMGPKNNHPQARLVHLKNIALEMLDSLLGHDKENSSINIRPDFTGGNNG